LPQSIRPFPDTATGSDRSLVWSLESIEPFSFSILPGSSAENPSCCGSSRGGSAGLLGYLKKIQKALRIRAVLGAATNCSAVNSNDWRGRYSEPGRTDTNRRKSQWTFVTTF
jgi:hypothetical protein